MTSAEQILRIRILADEVGVTSGFWSDTNLYKCLDTAQNIIIDLLLNKQKAGKLAMGNYEVEALKPLIKLNNSVTINSTSNAISISGITDLIELYSVELYNHDQNIILPLTLLGLYELKRRNANTYTAHSYDPTTTKGNVYCAYYNGTILTSFTDGQYPYSAGVHTGYNLDKINIYYYHQPSPVASGTNFTLPSNTHEAGIFFATAQAFYQDGKKNEGDSYYEQALQLINGL